jgi:basic membrane lipoprotein Med (substrate-binding protein (PBP1-ABC) superfamily)
MTALARLRLQGPRLWITVLTCAVVVTGLAIWIATRGDGTAHIKANNISRNFRACLLTDGRDAQSSGDLWAGMQEAARTTPVNAQRIVAPATTTASLVPYVNSMVARKCGLIIAAGPDLHDAVATAAQHNPHQEFLYTGNLIHLANVTSLPHPTRDSISTLVKTAAQKQHHPAGATTQRP